MCKYCQDTVLPLGTIDERAAGENSAHGGRRSDVQERAIRIVNTGHAKLGLFFVRKSDYNNTEKPLSGAAGGRIAQCSKNHGEKRAI